MPAEMEPEERRTHDHSHSSKSEESGNYAADMQESALRGDVNNKSPKMAATTQAANGARDRQTDTAAGAVETTGTSDRDECFRECMRRLVEEVLPLVQTYPPKMAGSESEVMNAAIDLVLYRNLADAIEFCYVESDGRFTERQLAQLAAVARTRIIPAYLSFFRAHFGTRVHAGECGSEAESSLGPSTDKSFYFFVRQESNASWPKLIWRRIKELYYAALEAKSSDSHGLGVRMAPGVLDVLARLLELFFPMEPQVELHTGLAPPRRAPSFSPRLFELLQFDLRTDDPPVLAALLQAGLVDRRDAFVAKNAFYILNRMVVFTREAPLLHEDCLLGGHDASWKHFVVVYGAMQEAQVHLIIPLLPTFRSLLIGGAGMETTGRRKQTLPSGGNADKDVTAITSVADDTRPSTLPIGWWRVLVQRGLASDSAPVRRAVLHTVLQLDARQIPALCTPDGLDFCLGDLFALGLDPNSALFVASAGAKDAASGSETGVDLGDAVSVFYGRLVAAYSGIDVRHARAIVHEMLEAIVEGLRAPVALIYALRGLARVSPRAILDDGDLATMRKIAALPYLHNQRARLLVKRLLLETLMALGDATAISFAQLAATLHALLHEEMTLPGGELQVEGQQFGALAAWLDRVFGPAFLREQLAIAIARFYAEGAESETEGGVGVSTLRTRASVLATIAVFSLGAADGRFVAAMRPVLEQLALVVGHGQSLETVGSLGDDGSSITAVPAFVLFLAMNETVEAVLRNGADLVSHLGLAGRIFDWLAFVDAVLFGCGRVSFPATGVLLDAFRLLVDRVQDTDSGQLLPFLDMLAFRLGTHLACDRMERVGGDGEDDNRGSPVTFREQLHELAALAVLAAVVRKLRELGRQRPDVVTEQLVRTVVRLRVERPAGLSETEWDGWPDFVTAYTEAKWTCVEALAGALEPHEGPLAVYASCLQAVEVSRHGGTLAILRCMETVLDLILSGEGGGLVQGALDGLMGRTVDVMRASLRSSAETLRWFDLYADAFIRLLFRERLLEAASIGATGDSLQSHLHAAFDFFMQDVGPKRRGIVGLVSARLGSFFVGNATVGMAALSQSWRGALLQLLLYGPVRGSADETVAARITQTHVPDTDYQVRVHAATVLNHVRDSELARDLLVDLIGQQEALAAVAQRHKMFPGDFNHRVQLRAWAGILLLISNLCQSDGMDETFAEKELLPMLWGAVAEETMLSTRAFMEWSLALVYLTHPERLVPHDLMSSRISYQGTTPSVLVSIIAVVLLVAKRLDSVAPHVARSVFLPRICHLILPLLAHNNHIVRMHAIHAFRTLYQQSSMCSGGDRADNVPGYRLLAGFVDGAEHCRKFVQKLENEPFLSSHGVDPLDDCTLEWIFGRMMRHGGVEGEAIEYYAFMNYHERSGVVPFVGTTKPALSDAPSVERDGVSSASDGAPGGAPGGTPNDILKPLPATVEELFREFQQKIDIYSPFALDRSTDDAPRGGIFDDPSRRLETEIVVIGSLVDRLPNLAGLARSCEIFGVRTLYVPNVAELASPDFVNVAMTAERWLDIRQLIPAEVAQFIGDLKRKDGFTIVALEQTTNSTPLHAFTFPRRTCLVVGNERTGIPAEVLHLVDECVEIPQFGRVRSLNVHVSGSIAIWKAREQDLL